MKQKDFRIRLSWNALFIFFPFTIITRKKRGINYLFLLIIAVSLSGCFRNFYQTDTKSSIDTATLSRLISEKKYFVIHFGNTVNGLENAHVKNDSLYGNITRLASEHAAYLDPNIADTTLRIRPGTAEYVLSEVHLYTEDKPYNSDSMFAIGVSSFNRADVYKLNKKATHENHIMSVVGVTVGFFALLSIVALAACGCAGGY